MTFLPIVTRELRVRCRRRSTYWLRAGAALLAFVVAGGMLVVHRIFSSGPMMGSALFAMLSWLIFLFCFLEGTRNGADCLSEEKREGTLGLLFLTDLRGYDVVLGKFAATSLNSFYGLLALLPMLALSLLLGGVTPGQFWAMALTLVNTLFFALSAAILVSTLSRNNGKAWAGTFALMLIITAGCPALSQIAPNLLRLAGQLNITVPGFWHSVVPWVEHVALASPAVTFFHALSGQSGNVFWPSLLGVHVVAWIFLILASILLPRAWQDKPARTTRRSLIAAASGGGERKVPNPATREKLMRVSPVAWLALRNDRQRIYIWTVVLCSTVAAGIGAYFTDLEAVDWFLVPTKLILRVWVAFQACRLFTEARQSGALELLLSTPLTTREIINGQILALKRLFFWPVIVLVAVPLALMLAKFFTQPLGIHAPWVEIVALGYSVLTFATNLLALSFFGMWMALKLKKPTQAVGLTLLFVLVLPKVILCLPTLLSDVFFIFWSRSRLERQLRHILLESLKR